MTGDRGRLRAAYETALYRIDTPVGCFDLRAGGFPPAAFDDWLRDLGVNFWGIVTACNPGSRLCAEGENRRANEKLSRRIDRGGWLRYPACNLSDGGDWPAEPGFLLLGPDERELCRLAQGSGQFAFVSGERGKTLRVCWTPDGS